MLYWQPFYGTLTALGLGCLVAAGLAWQQRISWLVLPLVPLGTGVAG